MECGGEKNTKGKRQMWEEAGGQIKTTYGGKELLSSADSREH